MILFTSLGVSISLMLIGMFFLGTWPNLFKYREKEVYKEHVFIIYVVAAFLTSLVFAFTMGSLGPQSPNFVDNLKTGDASRVFAAIAGGVSTSLSNLFMVFAIELSGVAVVMPAARGISVIGGTLLNHAISPVSTLWLLILGVILILIALIFESIALFEKEKYQLEHPVVDWTSTVPVNINTEDSKETGMAQQDELAKAEIMVSSSSNSSYVGEVKKRRVLKDRRGIIIAIISGVIGCFWPPLSTYAMQKKGLQGTLTAYTTFFYFMIGFLISGIATNIYFLYKPLGKKKPASISVIFHLSWKFYIIGAVAGVLSSIGTVFDFIAGQSSGGFAVAYAISQANALVSGVYGIIIWKEFANTNMLAKICYVVGSLFYIGAIICLAFSL